jgi:hypothetical protein
MTGKRLLWTVVLGLLLGAAALWGASKLVWAEPPRELSWPTALAVVALAAVGAVLALAGLARRVLGVLLVLAGVAAVVLAVVDAELFGIGPVLGLLGGVLIFTAGGVLIARGASMPRLGAKYSAPAAKRASEERERDPWKALSEGEDPTLHP